MPPGSLRQFALLVAVLFVFHRHIALRALGVFAALMPYLQARERHIYIVPTSRINLEAARVRFAPRLATVQSKAPVPQVDPIEWHRALRAEMGGFHRAFRAGFTMALN